MGFSGFGYSIGDGGDPVVLDHHIRILADVGFTHVELGAWRWELWNAGTTNARVLARFADVIDRHRDRMKFTLHGPMWINLFDTTNADVNRRLLHAGMEVNRALGTEVMVYHPGHRMTPPAGSADSMLDLLEMERDIIRDVADAAAVWGGRIALENMPWEPKDAYSYSVWPDQLVRQVEAIDHRNVGICIDFGHLQSAAQWYGFDVVKGAQTMAPYTIHTHVQDLTGFPAAAENEYEAGRGDLHLPPGWGTIDFDAIFSATRFPKHPVFHVEARGGTFLPYADSTLAEARRLAALEPVAVASTSGIDVRAAAIA